MDFSKVKEWQIPEGKVKSVSVGGVVIWQAKTQAEQLTAPTISLDGSTLTMTATDDRTQEFVIFVDGVETETVENEKEETYTVSGTWRFNKTLTLPDTAIKQRVKGIFNDGTSFDGFNIKPTEVIEWDGYTNNTTLYADGVWENTNYRLIVFDGVQTVSKEFYEWLVANATRPISGIYKFSDLYDIHDLGFKIDLNFTSNGQTFTNINGDSAGTYYDDTLVWKVNTNWVSENYRYIEIVGTQYLYYWEYWEIMAVATKVFAFTIDGTTYYAKEGMTWGEWVESEYNTGGFIIGSSINSGEYYTITTTQRDYTVAFNSNTVFSTDVINENEYQLIDLAGGGGSN